MTNDDIILMAQKAGMVVVNDQFSLFRALVRFATLVAAHEREKCAKGCDDMEQKAEGTDCCKWPTPADCAAAIRARSEE